MKCDNEKCTLHAPVTHGATCGKSGNTACKDHLHTKTCHTKDDLAELSQTLSNYIDEKNTA